MRLPINDIYSLRQTSKRWNKELQSREFEKLWLARENAIIDKDDRIVEWSPVDSSESLLSIPRCVGKAQLIGGNGTLLCIGREFFQRRFSLIRSGRKVLGLSNCRALDVDLPPDESLFVVWDVVSGQKWKIVVPNLPYTLSKYGNHWLFDGEAVAFSICGCRSMFAISLFPLATTKTGVAEGAVWRSDRHSWSKVPTYEFKHAHSSMELKGSQIFWTEIGSKIIIAAFDLFAKAWSEVTLENEPLLIHGENLEGWLMFKAGNYVCGLALVKKGDALSFEPWRIEENGGLLHRGPLCWRQMAPWDSALQGLQLHCHGKWIFVGFDGVMSVFDAEKFLWSHMNMNPMT